MTGRPEMRWMSVIATAGLIAGCGQGVKGETIVFNCDPLSNGQIYQVTFRKGDSDHVEVMSGKQPYRFEEVNIDKKEAEEGWRRWITNTSRDGVANSWSELNTKTGALRLIDIDGNVELQGSCFRTS